MLKRLSHPFISELKRYVASQNKNLGPLVMSISAAIGVAHKHCHKLEEVVDKQRMLSEITDMIHAAHVFHRCLIDEDDPLLHQQKQVHNSTLAAKALHQDNVMSLLLGDYLLAQSSVDVAEIRHPRTVGLVAAALEDFTRGEYLKIELLEDRHAGEHTHKMIEKYAQLTCGSLLSNSCVAASLLAGYDDNSDQSLTIHQVASKFGHRTGTAYRLIGLFFDQELNIQSDEKLVQDLDKRYFEDLILENLNQSEESLKPIPDSNQKTLLLETVESMRRKVRHGSRDDFERQ